MSEFSQRRLAGLDLVRSVAILSVVVGHYWPLYNRFPALAPFQHLGVLGVEIFFVLSGFLIGGILLRQAADLDGTAGGFSLRHAPDFWIRRWFRTLPNYALFLVLFLLMDQPWTKETWGAWALSLLFLQNLFSNQSEGTFFVAWSLCVEEWLYLLLPLVLAAFTALHRKSGRAALHSALLLIVVPTLLRCASAGEEWDLGIRRIVVYRVDSIAYGVLLAYLGRYHGALFARLASTRCALAGTFGLIVIAGFWWAIGEPWVATDAMRTGFPWFVMSVVFFPALSITVMPIIAWASRLGDLPVGCRTLVYRTSLYSYSMYLAHMLVFHFTDFVLYRAILPLVGEFRGLTITMFALNLALVYGISAFVFHMWEAPMTRLRERFAPARPMSAVS